MIKISDLGILLIAAVCLGLSAAGWHWSANKGVAPSQELTDRVVVPAPVQLLLAGGDRFLAADIEAIRASATTSDLPSAITDNLSFSIRSRDTVARLNPCHEDNYYLANALLTWGGATSQGNEVLRLATTCRYWDEFPPFFYGFNLYYFDRNITEAKRMIDVAADRSQRNANPLRKLAIMLTAENFKDDNTALTYLESERDHARDAKLRETLEKRVQRLQGLILLRQAQKTYEERFGKPLAEPNELLSTGILQDFPIDPLKIGYEFDGVRFNLRQVKIAGLEMPGMK